MHSLSGSKRASGLRAAKARRPSAAAAEWLRATKTDCKKKVEEKFGSYKFSSYLCKVFPPHENERPQGLTEAGREIPENIERLTIDKDKKVQELINETGSFARENAGVNS